MEGLFHKKKTKNQIKKSILTLSLMSALLLFSVTGLIQVVHASDPTYSISNSFTLDSASCTTNGGSWDTPTSTCTIPANVEWDMQAVLLFFSGPTITVTAGTTLVNQGTIVFESATTCTATNFPSDCDGTIQLDAGSSFSNYGTINISDSPAFTNKGVFNNYGTITALSCDTNNSDCQSIDNNGVVNNYGTINENFGDLNLDTSATFNNYGAINIGTHSASSCFGLSACFSVGFSATVNNYGTIANAGLQVVNAGGAIFNYGTYTDESGQYGFTGLSAGAIVNECTGTINPASLNTAPIALQVATNCVNTISIFSHGFSSLSSAVSSIQLSLNDLSTSLASGFGSLSTAISNLDTHLTNVNTDIDTQISTAVTTIDSHIDSSISGLQTSIDASITSAVTTLATDIGNIGKTGPLVGTSNDAAVATSPTFSSVSSFSSSASKWTQISPSTGSDRVVSGFTLSAISGTATNAVLYISTSNTPASSSSAYAIPLGTLKAVSTAGSETGQLRFPFDIPMGSTVYVQVVSTTGATVTVQLQLLNTPIN